jgi:hypothetical protein
MKLLDIIRRFSRKSKNTIPIRDSTDILHDIINITSSQSHKLIIVVNTIEDDGNTLEKTIVFKVSTNNEFATDFQEFLSIQKDKKFQIRFE